MAFETAQSCDIIVDLKPTFGHTALVVPKSGTDATGSGRPPKGVEVLHAGGGKGGGVYRSQWTGGVAPVYRHLPLTAGESQSIVDNGDFMTMNTSYGTERALFKSWTGSSSYGRKAQSRLEKYAERIKNGKMTIVRNLFCSEFVVLSIQLGLNLDRTHGAWLDLDGQHTLPVTLKNYLEKNSSRWKCMGVVTDPSLIIYPS